VEILIIDDASKNLDEIAKVVHKHLDLLPYKTRFIKNEVNLGFDNNLAKLMDMSSSKYVMFMSDDDEFISGGLKLLIAKLIDLNVGMIYTSFIDKSRGLVLREHGTSFKIMYGEDSLKSYIYDSIMFSGLVFERQLLSRIKIVDGIKNYVQVFYFMYLMHHYDVYYINNPLFYANGDGENGFGLNSDSLNERLANRRGLYSNLEFHKGLISTIRTYDEQFNINLIRQFGFKYQLRTFPKLLEARHSGRRELLKYYKEIRSLRLGRNFIPYFYMVFISIFGAKFSSNLYHFAISRLLKKVQV
jgi:glycosyltransferase involved in cell wall biosynthesis